MKEKIVDFNKWLFDNNIVPNSYFLWFDSSTSRNKIQFYDLGDLFEAYDSGKTIAEFKKEQQNKVDDFINESLS